MFQSNGSVKRDTQMTAPYNIVDSFQRNVNRFRDCVDKALAAAASEVDEKQLQPIFNALGEQVNKFSKVVSYFYYDFVCFKFYA